MSDEGKCYAATPAATLEEHIINSNIAKSDTEWWAHHEITRLRADLAAITAERDRMREALRPFAAVLQERVAGGYYLVTFPTVNDFLRARAAIEGVTEPASRKEPDKHLNLRNAECLPSTVAIMKPEPPR